MEHSHVKRPNIHYHVDIDGEGWCMGLNFRLVIACLGYHAHRKPVEVKVKKVTTNRGCDNRQQFYDVDIESDE
jgi:hypothetical protein